MHTLNIGSLPCVQVYKLGWIFAKDSLTPCLPLFACMFFYLYDLHKQPYIAAVSKSNFRVINYRL